MNIKLNAAGEMTGFDIRYPSTEEAASVQRAVAIRDAGTSPIGLARGASSLIN
jgi:hypothetical protein